MKRILGILITGLVCAFCTAVAHADCASNEFSVTDTSTNETFCVESKFEITTIDMPSGTTFSFNLYRYIGKLNVDWGDTTEIYTGNNTAVVISHPYSGGGVQNIRFGSVPTGYGNANTAKTDTISFSNNTNRASLSGALVLLFPTLGTAAPRYTQPRFGATFFGCTNLTTLPSGLFDGITGTAVSNMFNATFCGCSGLETIPSDLFSGLTGISDSAFQSTFQDCTNLTGALSSNLFGTNPTGGASGGAFNKTFSGCRNLIGPIPDGLFGAPTGSAGNSAFRETFSDCRNLIGTIPPNLFGNITSASGSYVFYQTFRGCYKLTGYIPVELFDSITSVGSTATGDMFAETKVYTSCPCGTIPAETGWGVTSVNGRAVCTVGKKANEHFHNGTCTNDCALGFTELKTSNGLSYPVLSDKVSNPAINIGVGNNVCYVPLAAGTVANAINVSDGANLYHAVVPDEMMPVGFTGQPE